MAEASQVNIPKVGKTKKSWVWAAMAVAGGFVVWKWYTASKSADSEVSYTTDYVSEPLPTGGAGAAGGSGNVQYAGSTTDNTSDDVIDTNAEWTNRAAELLSNAGYDPATVYSALGDYLAQAPLTSSEQTIVRAALAAVGNPPTGGPYVIKEQVGEVTLTAPAGLKATTTTFNSVTLSWSSVTGAGGYYVYRSGMTSNPIQVSGTTATIVGLEPNTTYTFQVAAYTTTGKAGPKSSSVSAKTKSVTLAKPATPTVSAITKNSAQVTTKPVSGARGYLWYINGVAHGHSDNPSYKVVSLRSNTPYTVSVKADTPTQGPGPESAKKSFRTKR